MFSVLHGKILTVRHRSLLSLEHPHVATPGELSSFRPPAGARCGLGFHLHPSSSRSSPYTDSPMSQRAWGPLFASDHKKKDRRVSPPVFMPQAGRHRSAPMMLVCFLPPSFQTGAPAEYCHCAGGSRPKIRLIVLRNVSTIKIPQLPEV